MEKSADDEQSQAEMNEDDRELCERYGVDLKELNTMLEPYEKMLLLRNLPEPPGANWKRLEKKPKPSVKEMAAMMKDSPLLKMAAKMKPKPPPPPKLMQI